MSPTNLKTALCGLTLCASLCFPQSGSKVPDFTPADARKLNEALAQKKPSPKNDDPWEKFFAEMRNDSDPFTMADQLRKAGKNTEALQAVNEALRIDPNRGEAYGLRSGIEANLRQFADGVADGDMGIKLSKTPRQKAMAAYNKGFSLTALDQKQAALEAYKLALQFDPTYSMAHFGRGKLFGFLGMWKEAKAELDSTVSISPTHGAAWALLADAQFHLGAISDGTASAEKAVLLAPNDSRSFRARAIARQLGNRFEEMLSDATRAVELEPARPLAHLLRGKALGLLGRLDDALAEYALEPDRKAVEPYLNGVHREMYGTRFYNCGDTSTEFEVPGGPRIDTFEDCKKRVLQALGESAAPSTPPKPVRKSVPNLPARRRATK